MDEDYCAAPLSREDINRIANRFRDALGFSDRRALPVVKVLEYGLPQLIDGFNYEIVADDELPGREAETYPGECTIKVSQSTYLKACRHDPHARFTLAHEMGHLFLHTPQTLSLAYETDAARQPKIYEKPGWQADAFAAELLAPVRMVHGMDEDEIAREFMVSKTFAERQFDLATRKTLFGHCINRDDLLPGFEMPPQRRAPSRKGGLR